MYESNCVGSANRNRLRSGISPPFRQQHPICSPNFGRPLSTNNPMMSQVLSCRQNAKKRSMSVPVQPLDARCSNKAIEISLCLDFHRRVVDSLLIIELKLATNTVSSLLDMRPPRSESQNDGSELVYQSNLEDVKEGSEENLAAADANEGGEHGAVLDEEFEVVKATLIIDWYHLFNGFNEAIRSCKFKFEFEADQKVNLSLQNVRNCVLLACSPDGKGNWIFECFIELYQTLPYLYRQLYTGNAHKLQLRALHAVLLQQPGVQIQFGQISSRPVASYVLHMLRYRREKMKKSPEVGQTSELMEFPYLDHPIEQLAIKSLRQWQLSVI